ncbi:molybdopterin-binding protein [Flavimaricola marinus]|uniref:Putative molybdopterin binding domain protein n=1 Tax=Flavimaricola marinus TaxID=1819565 RepID=A0A238LDZ8_9RHOB|nr:molybdopterin-binding protein [Flavimaricola marinus]SMY07851.1 putative molybdopterin binding domain protein [Flavimaricola marinus]
MRFGPVPVAEAEGAYLAHSVTVGKGKLRKGLCLGPAEIDLLREAGRAEVTVARLDPGDVHEDAAAARVASALLAGLGASLRAGQAATGRVNLYAREAGLLAVDPDAVTGLNAVNPSITLATLPPLQRVAPGDMVGTVKIISYAVLEADLQRAAHLAEGAIAFRTPRLRTACLIETQVPGQTLAPKGRASIRARLERLNMTLAPRIVVPHEVAPLAEAVAAAESDLVLILTGSATSDLDDVAPSAVRGAGGTIERFGMPVDPGNLLFLGALGGKPVIGLPGCARSPALNGADWVLERVICAVPVDSAAIAAMGVGGLLKDIASRPRPRRTPSA